VLGGWLPLRVGGKPVLAAAVAVWSAATLLTPVAADVSIVVLLSARCAFGIWLKLSRQEQMTESVRGYFGVWLGGGHPRRNLEFTGLTQNLGQL
jgi:MFS family permease